MTSVTITGRAASAAASALILRLEGDLVLRLEGDTVLELEPGTGTTYEGKSA